MNEYHRERRRFGRFHVSRDLIETYPEEVRELMSHMIVVRAELSYVTNATEYLAISPLFEPLEEGLSAPEYVIQCTVTHDDQGNRTSIKFEARRLTQPEGYSTVGWPVLAETSTRKASGGSPPGDGRPAPEVERGEGQGPGLDPGKPEAGPV